MDLQNTGLLGCNYTISAQWARLITRLACVGVRMVRFTCVGCRCDPIWQVTLRSCVTHDLKWLAGCLVCACRTRKPPGWSNVWWRWLLPRTAVCPRLQLARTSHRAECSSVDRTTWQPDQYIRWSMPLAIRRSCAGRTARTATVGTGTSASSRTVPPNCDQPSAILATRLSSARSTIQLASVRMDRGILHCRIVSSHFLFEGWFFLQSASTCSFLLIFLLFRKSDSCC